MKTDSDEEYCPQAFERPPRVENDDLSLPPTSGHHYLSRVIDEAEKLEGLLVANIQIPEKECSQNQNVNELTEECSNKNIPRPWQIAAVKDFSQLRLDVKTLREKYSSSELKTIGKSMPPTNQDDAWLKIVQSTMETGPSSKYCLALPQLTIWNLLSFFNDWLSDGLVSVTGSCRWIYCLLACLDIELPPNVHFSLRQIGRFLINYKTKLEDPWSHEVPPINLVISIIGHQFSQRDLVGCEESP